MPGSCDLVNKALSHALNAMDNQPAVNGSHFDYSFDKDHWIKDHVVSVVIITV